MNKIQKIILISCGKSKLDHAAPAEELYTGQLFKASLTWAKQQNADHIFILSAKHHVLKLDQVVEPYEECLDGKQPHELETWARVVHNHLHAFTGQHGGFEITFLAGRMYRDQKLAGGRTSLITILEQYETNTIIVPMEGLGIGQQLGWLKNENDETPFDLPETTEELLEIEDITLIGDEDISVPSALATITMASLQDPNTRELSDDQLLDIKAVFEGQVVAFSPTMFGLGIAVEDKAGYWPVPTGWYGNEDYLRNAEYAEQLNQHGLNLEEVEAARIVLSSMKAQGGL